MKTPINNDNIYKIGTTIHAHQNPDVELVIISYKARIYYCTATRTEQKNVIAYFEHELIEPATRKSAL